MVRLNIRIDGLTQPSLHKEITKVYSVINHGEGVEGGIGERRIIRHIKLVQAVRLPNVFGRFQVRISAGTPIIFAVIPRGLPQSLQSNVRIVP